MLLRLLVLFAESYCGNCGLLGPNRNELFMELLLFLALLHHEKWMSLLFLFLFLSLFLSPSSHPPPTPPLSPPSLSGKWLITRWDFGPIFFFLFVLRVDFYIVCLCVCIYIYIYFSLLLLLFCLGRAGRSSCDTYRYPVDSCSVGKWMLDSEGSTTSPVWL